MISDSLSVCGCDGGVCTVPTGTPKKGVFPLNREDAGWVEFAAANVGFVLGLILINPIFGLVFASLFNYASKQQGGSGGGRESSTHRGGWVCCACCGCHVDDCCRSGEVGEIFRVLGRFVVDVVNLVVS